MMIDYAKEVTSQTEEELETAEGSKMVFSKKGNGEILNRAILYATEKHWGMLRKGSHTPYILHPLEAAAIVAGITDDEEVMSAAVLHDTVEDTGTSIEEIKKIFGTRIATLVADESEDKREDQKAEDTWKVRKQETIDHLSHASRDAKIIALGDKLSNMRAMKRDYTRIGDELWKRFNQKDPAEHGWYYRSIGKALESELGDTPEWQEYMRLVEEVWGR